MTVKKTSKSKTTKKVSNKVKVNMKAKIKKEENTKEEGTLIIKAFLLIALFCFIFAWGLLSNKDKTDNKVASINQSNQTPITMSPTKKNTKVEPKNVNKVKSEPSYPVRKESGYTKKDVGASEQIFDKNGRIFYRNVMTDQYFTYLNEKDGYWLADETYVARHFGDTFTFGTRTFYRYKGNYYEQLANSIIKVTSEEFYEANYANPPFLGKSPIIDKSTIPHFEGKQHVTYVTRVGEYGYEVIGEDYITDIPKKEIK